MRRPIFSFVTITPFYLSDQTRAPGEGLQGGGGNIVGRDSIKFLYFFKVFPLEFNVIILD